ncbi:MAG: ABC transporter ATP-binding protein [Azospirillaceae bacterium]
MSDTPDNAVPVLDIAGYTLDYLMPTGTLRALEEIDLTIARGEVMGLVGESGSGKSTLAFAIMRDLAGNAREQAGTIRLSGTDLRGLSTGEFARFRGRRIGMVFQDPGTALNPTMTLGTQVAETLVRHHGLDWRAAWKRGTGMLERVGLKTPAAMMARYPHEVSGGEKQRVAIATAFACQPECILFDEPTTALDIITARSILDLFRELQAETGVASLYISHDLALVSEIAHRVAVIHRGRIVEEEPADEVFRAPREDYTKQLIASVPRPDRPLTPPLADATGETPLLLELDGVGISYGRPSILKRLFGRSERVVGARDVSFAVRPGEILGLVGESGSGKSTIARALVGLNAFSGQVRFAGRTVAGPRDMDAGYRRNVQIIFQHPDSSLNPRQRVEEILARSLILAGTRDRREIAATIGRLLEDVALPVDFRRRFPHQLSGGEKQRVAIARAFASRPRLVICDEITSALDVSIQAQIVRLLLDLRERYGTAYLFITHDLNLVRQIAHRLVVMYRGDVVETAPVETIATVAAHAYTRELLGAVPTPVG